MRNGKCRYALICGSVTIEEQEVTAYGISVMQDGKETIRYEDISPDRESVNSLVSMLNKMDARSVHLEDILQDYLP